MSTIRPGLYKILSSVDSNCIDCEGGGGKKKTKIISWHFGGGDNQKFQIHAEGAGFRLASLVRGKDNVMLVVEHSEKEKGIVLWDFNGDKRQQWHFVPVRGSEGAYLIKNVNSGLCLRSMGHGSPLQAFAEAGDDKSQWWTVAHVEEKNE